MSLLRPSSYGGGGGAGGAVDELVVGGGDDHHLHHPDDMLIDDPQQQQEGDDADEEDDNEAAVDEVTGEKEDPLLLAIDDLEGRVVAAIDDVKLHPGVKTSDNYKSVHEELATLLQPVVEVAAHTSPSIARTYHHGVGDLGIEQSVGDVYERVVSDLVLPVLLEMAQSETIPTKRCAALEFFKLLWRECHKAGSWLDNTVPSTSLQQGPYGSGASSSSSSSSSSNNAPGIRAVIQRRQVKRLVREGEILRYWVQASIACTLPGVFSNDGSASAVACRGILAAAASLRPSLWHISQKIKDADDRGATRLYMPVMKMIEGVLKQLFLSQTTITSTSSEPLISGCVKFLEIVVMCCSLGKPKEDTVQQKQSRHHRDGKHHRGDKATTGNREFEDFSLEELPLGHPIITRDSLESIAEYAFTTLRGLTLMGGQVKMDVNLLSDLMLSTGGGGSASSPSAQVVSILKPAALAFLEMEDSLPKLNDDNLKNPEKLLEYNLDRASCEYDFILAQKSYSISINAMSALAMNRPVYFQESSLCLARRAIQPPSVSEYLKELAIKALAVQLKSSCLTLLRNALSVTTKSFYILHAALKQCDMEIQADKAMKMAQQTTALKTAGRAARNRANLYYEWEGSAADSSASTTGQKRLRETDDALAQMRAAKAARGLGHGIQLPTSMSDAVELVIVNLKHLPSQRPKSAAGTGASNKLNLGAQAVTLDFVVDAVMTNGASLHQEEGRWYDRDGGTAWSLDLSKYDSKSSVDERDQPKFELGIKLQEVVLRLNDVIDHQTPERETKEEAEFSKQRKLYREQCNSAAADALSRIVNQACYHRSKSLANLGNQIASRLAFTLGKVMPSSSLRSSYEMAKDSAKEAIRVLSKDGMNDSNTGGNDGDELTHTKEALERLVDSYPQVALGVALGATANNGMNKDNVADVDCSLSLRLLNEALLQGTVNSKDTSYDSTSLDLYDSCLELWVASIVQANKLANDKPGDNERKKCAARAAANLQKEIVNLPRLTRSSLLLVSALCDIEDITKKALEASRKTTSQESIAVSAAFHAAKAAAEKRATAALLVLRDAAFQRDFFETRKCAVECAVALAAGRLPSVPSIQEKSLKLTMNVLYSKNDTIAELVVQSATSELKYFSKVAVDAYDAIKKANDAASDKNDPQKLNPLAPHSDEEKEMMNRMRKPAVLYMALCVRRPDIIETLFQLSSIDKADVLSKTVRLNMSKLARAAALKDGAADIAMRVASMCSSKETPMLLSFLENLAPTDKNDTAGEAEIIEACFRIQELKPGEEGKKDPRYVIPVVSLMKRQDLVNRLPEFVAADDNIFLAALERMNSRLSRQALLFRDEDEENPTLHGMTLCEELVFLHKIDFAAAGLPQKRYLAAIKICLEDDEVYNDRVVMSALDHMSGTFLTGAEPLPLAFMRTVILTCTKHESLHSWICHVLLPRLIDGQIYNESRQWEGWMRAAHMLEKNGDSNVNSKDAIAKLPPDKLMIYRTKWAGK